MPKYKMGFKTVQICATYVEASSRKEAVTKLREMLLDSKDEVDFEVECEGFKEVEVYYEVDFEVEC
ncbi:MAG: hypothetical protein J7525_19855 [Roseofilum sp. SID3]|uniref:hypothetical protein n=1 Tax=Roseofilum sp. SID3 TaxID=2821499 RepID=UPI001B0CA061|nr:hypothetical protein [Roseofilum sp. SID3]MBP0015352.1 hypothetical protein [Roseofilum sp. SID3]